MKKTFLLIATLFIMGSTAFAEGNVNISIGPKVGYQAASLSYQLDSIKAGFLNHFTLGVFGHIEIGNFFIQPEVLWFNTKNAFDLTTNVDHNFNIGDIEVPSGANLIFTRNAMNLQVPILVGYKFNIIENILGVRVQAGPTLNFTIPQSTVVSKSVGDAETQAIDNKDFDTNTVAFGLQGGIGIDVIKRITIDVNYNFGISKVFGSDLINNTQWGQYVNTSNISDVHNNLFMVTIGYKIINLGK